MKPNLNLTLGALPLSEDNYHFQVWAPYHPTLALEITQNAKSHYYPMQRDPHGVFSIQVPKLSPGALYHYCFSENQKRPDPASRYQPQGVSGPSCLVNADFPWTDSHWSRPTLDQYIIYELHVGTYTPEGTFSAIIPHLDSLHELGITAIELMPVAQFSGYNNWGYDGVFPFAVQNSYGGPDGLRELVNACHEKNIAVILDVVYNHLGPEGNYFNEFAPYFTDHYRTPWGSALNFDTAHNHHVRRYFIENALHWFSEYHIDALRLDALHAIYDASAYPFLRELADHSHAFAKKNKKPSYLIAESDLNDTRLLLPAKKGGYGLDAQWNDDFHHALHSLLTKEQHSYYQDFGDIADFIKAYREGFVYSGQYSNYRQKPHGISSKKIPASRLVVFAQNHDQIGNRLHGDRLAQNLTPEQLRLAAGLMILSPYIPLLFMGEEYAETAPFYFFTNFKDEKLIHAVREGRAREFSWQGEIPDPQSLKTFLAAKLHHDLKQQKANQQILQFYQRLIQLRKSHPVLTSLNKEELKIHFDKHSEVIWIERQHVHEKLIIVFHFNAQLTTVNLPVKGLHWEKILDSTESIWGGTGNHIPKSIAASEFFSLSLPAFALVVFSNSTQNT
ncbi:MAG TPA: malto-oligosyltrehalose trehalohydrolase [Gammaproteobacteria bacterium]|nr:malto-oligosyltrehalose trehalohydrolase [Gammaproteobacteria bacterium]